MMAPPAKISGYVASMTEAMSASGRKAGHEYLAVVSSKFRNGVVDHFPDRKRLAVATCDVAWQKPRETILRIVGRPLLGIDDREAKAVGERPPAGAVVIIVRDLGAAMQCDDQWRHGRQVLGNVGEHTKIAGICTKPGQF